MNIPHAPNRDRRSHRAHKPTGSQRSAFHPATAAIQHAYERVAREMENHTGPPHWFAEPVRDPFVMPVTRRDLRRTLDRVPARHTRGLKGVFLLGGTRKQQKVFFSELYCYGTYWNECIFLHPYPRNRMNMYFSRSPKPSLLEEYRRVGALVTRGDQEGVWVRFRRETLKHFYLRDVFMHELGHHADRDHDKSHHRSEGFADWFANEYGFRRWQRG